jgi:hypothetical protein
MNEIVSPYFAAAGKKVGKRKHIQPHLEDEGTPCEETPREETPREEGFLAL